MLMKLKQLSPEPWVKKHDRGQGPVKYWAPSPAFPSGDGGEEGEEQLPEDRFGSEAWQRRGRSVTAISPALDQNTPSAGLRKK